MKLAELKKAAAPPVAESVSAEASPLESPQEEPQGYTSVTPSGIEVYYQPAKDEPKQRRLYRVNGTEVPSVTTVLDVLGKDLTWWGQGVGIDGVLALFRKGLFDGEDIDALTQEQIVPLLIEHKLTTNDVRDSAADRGTNVHGALEFWVSTGTEPQWDDFPETESGYVKGLSAFLLAIQGCEDVQSEIMVGSVNRQYAGRFDLAITLKEPIEVVGYRYKKREIPAGRWLVDLKTRKGGRNYKTDFLQLEAYEAAAVECGYAPTDHRAVVIASPDGRYKFLPNEDWSFEDFLSVRQCYQTMHERKIVQALRDELGAVDA